MFVNTIVFLKKELPTFLDSYKNLDKEINEEKLWDIYENCIKILVYLHFEGVIHCDIKINNILMNNEEEIKYTDFEISLIIDIEKEKKISQIIWK